MNIRSLGYAWIESTEPRKWLDYGTGILGAMVAPGMPRSDDLLYLKLDERPFRFAIEKGAEDGLRLLGWELYDEADFEAAKGELEAAGVAWRQGTAEEARARRVQALVRLRDPAGNALELYHAATGT